MTSELIERLENEELAKQEAVDWLLSQGDGFPRSREQEAKNTKRRGYELYGENEVPTIAGYEALEVQGYAERVGTVMKGGEERVHFRITDTGLNALQASREKERPPGFPGAL